INARTDVFLAGVGEPSGRLEHAVRRANAYHAAGADCLFVPRGRDAETIGRLARALEGPPHVPAGAGRPPAAAPAAPGGAGGWGGRGGARGPSGGVGAARRSPSWRRWGWRG